MSVSGLASITPFVMLNSSSAASCCSAALSSASPGHEHHHDVGRRLEVRPVALVAEADDVILHLARVVLQLPVALRLVVALDRVEERRERDLGVDDDVLAAGQLDDRRRASAGRPRRAPLSLISK